MNLSGSSPMAAAKTEFVSVDGARLAYRAFGASGPVPLVLLMRFRGTMDHWDPAFVDPIAEQRPIVLLDNAGVGQSEGEVPGGISGMAEIVRLFAAAKGLEKIDVFGWSMGAAVGLKLTIDHPVLVRKLVFAGSGPGGIVDAPPMPQKVLETIVKPQTSEDDYLYLFFAGSEASREAGRSSLNRIARRTEAAAHRPVKPESFKRQLAAVGAWAQGSNSAGDVLESVQTPTLVLNGAHDVMVHPYNSYTMNQRMPSAQLILYPDSGHAFHFQYPAQVAGDVIDFLS